MSLLSVLWKAAALGAAANALLPTRCAQCIPLLEPAQRSTTDAATQDLVASMGLQDRGLEWGVEADDFKNGLRTATAQLQILRLCDVYTDSEGNKVPVLRLVGLFPGVSTDTLYRRLTEVQPRLEWDSNYTFYEGFTGDFSGTLQDASLLRPMAAVARKRPHCEGDVCTLVPDVSSSSMDHGWFCHGVGSPSLRRFGLVDRLFQYERLSHVFHFTTQSSAAAVPSLAMYDILYSGSRKTRDMAAAASPALAAWLQARRSSGDCEGVDVNFQHIALIPIADAEAQLAQQPELFHRLCTMGSVLDEATAKLVYGVFKDSQSRTEQGAAPLPASLLVMTSANNVCVPTFVPSWMQKKIFGSLSRKAYGELLDACVKDQNR